MTPTDDSNSDYSVYAIQRSFSETNVVGVVLPATGGYAVSPNATLTPDFGYDVSGCWGSAGAIVYAEPGLYSFLGVDPAAPEAPVAAQGLQVKAQNICFSNPVALAKAPAVPYEPMPATVAGGKTGLMIDNSNDAAITAVQNIFKARGTQFQPVGGGATPAFMDMVTNITAVFNNNAKIPIVAVEVGHGNPNCGKMWVPFLILILAQTHPLHQTR
jgi:hypothetical protein